MAGIFCLGNNKSLTNKARRSRRNLWRTLEWEYTDKRFLLSRDRYCVCIFVGERETLSKIHTFFSAGRIIVFTPENTQVTDKVVLKETLSWSVISTAIISCTPMTKMCSSREKKANRASSQFAGNLFLFLQKWAEGVLGEKINFAETRFAAHKQTWNGQLYKLKPQSYNGESQGILFLMVWWHLRPNEHSLFQTTAHEVR